MFKDTWEPWFERFPKIKIGERGGQNQFETFTSVYVPQEYLEDKEFREYDLAMNVGYRQNYWGGQVKGREYAVGGVEYLIAMNKD